MTRVGVTASAVLTGYLTPSVGWATTPDPNPVPVDCRWVYQVRGPTAAGDYSVARQWTGGGSNRSWWVNVRTDSARLFTAQPDGTGMNARVITDARTTTQEDVCAMMFSQTTGLLTLQRLVGSAFQTVGTNAGAPVALFDSTNPVGIGASQFGEDPFPGRIYFVEQWATNQAWLVFPGIVGNYLAVPDASPLRVTGDIEIVARISLAAASLVNGVTATIAARWVSAGNNRCYMFRTLGAAGGFQLLFNFTTDGVTGIGTSSATKTATTGTMLWVRVTRTASTGVQSYYTAPDQPTEPTTWTKLGTDQTAATGSMFAGTAEMDIGAYNVGTAEPLAGRIARTIVRSGIGGTTVLDVTENNAYGSSGTFTATTGQTVTANTTGSSAFLNANVGFATTPDPGPLPEQYVLVANVAHSGSGFQTLAAQFDTAGQQSWWWYVQSAAAMRQRTVSDGNNGGLVEPYLPFPTNARIATSMIRDNAGKANGTGYVWNGTAWVVSATDNAYTAQPVWDSTDPVRIGARNVNQAPWLGRIYSVELRTGVDPAGGTVVWRFDASEYPGTGTSYVDPRGRTWTLTVAGAITPAVAPIAQNQPDTLMWKFDAKDYPGTGTVYTDPRGRQWTLSAAGAITVA